MSRDPTMSSPPRAGPHAASASRLAPLASTVLVVAALYLAQDLFLPFAVAALFTFLLAPIVSLLQRLRLPRSVAVVATLLAALGGIGALGVTVVTQLDDLGHSLPEYRETIRTKLSALGGVVAGLEQGLSLGAPSAGGTASTSTGASTSTSTGGTASTGASAARGAAPWLLPGLAATDTAVRPLPVTVVPARPSPITIITDMAGPILSPIGTMAVIFVLVLFMLLYLEDLRDRIVRLLEGRVVTLSTQAATEVSQRISRYLLMNLIVNATYGVPVGVGLALLGIPNAFLWGLLATLLRFIPYVGPWLAAAMPIALSVAIAPGWGLTLAVLALFLVLELISNNLIEPWLYGSRTGLSPLAVIVAAVFWTWLWGPIGLLLSVPLTLIFVVSGRYVPALRFLYTLFGDGPGLGPAARFYQRLVAKDPDEAARVAVDYLARHPLPALYDAVVLPALRALKHDAAEGWIGPEQAEGMRASLEELSGALPAQADKSAGRRLKAARAEALQAVKATGIERVDAEASALAALVAPAPGATAPTAGVAPAAPSARVVFIPAGDATDALAGALLADLLRADGVAVTTLAPTALASELVAAGLDARPDVLVIGGFPLGGVARLKNLVTRAAERAPRGAPIIAALWDAPGDDDDPAAEAPAPPSRSVARFRRRRGPTVLEELRLAPGVVADARAVESLVEAGADAVVHGLAAAADAVRRALAHAAMGIAA